MRPCRLIAGSLLASLSMFSPVARIDARADAPPRAVARALTGGQSAADQIYFQVVAHPDDDLLFINPGLQNALGAGFGAVTVVLTAAEADGAVDGTQDRAHFAADRQEGLREAYASMVGIASQWSRSSMTLAGRAVEYDWLVNAPWIKIVFFDFYDGGDPQNSNSLLALALDTTATRYTFIPTGAIVQQSIGWTHATLRQALVQLLTAYQPYHINTLDPDPQLICGPVDPGESCWGYLDDNPDHISAASFIDEALQFYAGPNGTRTYDVFHHRGYGQAHYLGDLSVNNYQRKQAVCDVYKVHDRNFQYFYSNYYAYFGATYERYWGSTTWLQRMANGRLAAFTIQNRQVAMWVENSIGGTWTGPTRLPGGPMSHVDIVRYGDGRLRLFALQTPIGGGQSIVTCMQTAPSGPFGPWTDLGNPDATTWPNSPGWPAAAIDGTGHAWVFVRNGAGGVSRSVEISGVFGAWTALPGDGSQDLVDGLAAMRAPDGVIDVFGGYRGGLLGHWRVGAGGATYDGSFPSGPVAGPPALTTNADGRPEVFYHGAGYANVFTNYVTSGTNWSSPVTDLGGHGGIGPIASMLQTTSGRIMLFERNDYNGVSACWQSAPNDVFGGWVDLGGIISGLPAAATDGAGRAVVAAIGTDNRLYIRREMSGSVPGSFAGWQVVGTDPAVLAVPNASPPAALTLESRPSVSSNGAYLALSRALTAALVIRIHDVSGRVVRSLQVPPGATGVHWDGRDAGGLPAAAGVYFARAEAGAQRVTARLAVIH